MSIPTPVRLELFPIKQIALTDISLRQSQHHAKRFNHCKLYHRFNQRSRCHSRLYGERKNKREAWSDEPLGSMPVRHLPDHE